MEASRFATIFSVALSSVSVLVVVAAVGVIRRSSVVIRMVGGASFAAVVAERSCCAAAAATSTHGAGDWGSREATETGLWKNRRTSCNNPVRIDLYHCSCCSCSP